MTRALLEDLLAELRPAWTGPLDWDDSPVSASVRGAVASLPAGDAVERALAARGFTWTLESDEVMRRYWARRGVERLECALMTGDRLALDYRSNSRPAVGDGIDWAGRRWPAFFDDARLYGQHRDGITLEGQLPAGGFAAVVTRYQAWAAPAGLAPRIHEPDRVSFGDARHIVIVDDRHPFVLLTVHTRDQSS